MDKYIIERRARQRLAWFKRYENTGCVAEVCRHFQVSYVGAGNASPHIVQSVSPGDDATGGPNS